MVVLIVADLRAVLKLCTGKVCAGAGGDMQKVFQQRFLVGFSWSFVEW